MSGLQSSTSRRSNNRSTSVSSVSSSTGSSGESTGTESSSDSDGSSTTASDLSDLMDRLELLRPGPATYNTGLYYDRLRRGESEVRPYIKGTSFGSAPRNPIERNTGGASDIQRIKDSTRNQKQASWNFGQYGRPKKVTPGVSFAPPSHAPSSRRPKVIERTPGPGTYHVRAAAQAVGKLGPKGGGVPFGCRPPEKVNPGHEIPGPNAYRPESARSIGSRGSGVPAFSMGRRFVSPREQLQKELEKKEKRRQRYNRRHMLRADTGNAGSSSSFSKPVDPDRVRGYRFSTTRRL